MYKIIIKTLDSHTNHETLELIDKNYKTILQAKSALLKLMKLEWEDITNENLTLSDITDDEEYFILTTSSNTSIFYVNSSTNLELFFRDLIKKEK